MQIKKLMAGILAIAFLSLYTTPISAEVTKSSKQNLYYFLKNTEKITAKYSYPSMKLSATTTGKVKLAAHTPVVLRCDETITTRNIVDGGMVKFSILNDVKSSDDTILIKSGTPVTAIVSFSSPKGMIGKSGNVTITDFHTNAVDGSYVPLSSSISAKPEDKMVVSIVLSVLICPLFLLMKGEDAQVFVGTTKPAYTVNDVYVNVTRL